MLRRGLGYKMNDAGHPLPQFVSFMEERQAGYITARLAPEWIQQAPTVQPAERARRLRFVRGFARYRSAVDPRTEVPPVELLPHRSTRAHPYLYSEEEIQRLLDAALKLPTKWPSTPLRPRVFHCLLGLLSVTGLRISEALDLRLDDADLDQGVLTIRSAKFGRSRLVPLSPRPPAGQSGVIVFMTALPSCCCTSFKRGCTRHLQRSRSRTSTHLWLSASSMTGRRCAASPPEPTTCV